MGTLFSGLSSLFDAAGARFAVLGPPPIEPVAELDLKRYAGRWYQVALTRNAFQAQGAHNVTATYAWDAAKQQLDILNESWMGDERSWIRGVAIRDPEARGEDDDVTARLLVTFTPNTTSPFVWDAGSPYWVIQLGTALDYGYAVVSDPNRRHVWILSRTFPMDPRTLRDILLRLTNEQGFSRTQIDALEWTVHDASPPAYEGPAPSAPPPQFGPAPGRR